MNQNLLETIKNTIEELESAHRLEDARIFLFGMNTPGDRIIQYLGARGYGVEKILDNNPKNQGQTLLGVPVCSPEFLRGTSHDNILVLIASRYYREMCTQLERMGLKEGSNIIKLLEFETGIKVSDSQEAFDKAADRLKRCTEVYEQTVKDYEKDTHFLLCPIRANGDMYIAASLMQGLRDKEGIKRLVLITVGGIGKKIAAMFGEEDCHTVSQEQMDALVYITGVLGGSSLRLHMFYPKAFSYGIFANMECYKGLNYMDLTAGGMLGLDIKTLNRTKTWRMQLGIPEQIANTGQNRCDLENENFRFSAKDILLAPYANSLPCFSPGFWKKLTEELQNAGYNVYTNSDGDMEPAVEGTKPLFLPIGSMPEAMSGCAGFIAIRNGLCDVLSEASCRKIILYPNKGMGFGSVKDFYGLKAMGMCEDAVEIEYSEDRENEIIGMVVAAIRNR